MNQKAFDLDERLIDFATQIIALTRSFPRNAAAAYISAQLLRSGMAPALMYGEAHAAESPNDFIHKMKLALKELRETYNALRIAKKMNWNDPDCDKVIGEANQLIAIFVTSIRTAEVNQIKRNKNPDSSK